MIDFAKITPNLYVGSCPGNEIDIKQLRVIGVTGVLNLQTDADFEKWGINFNDIQQAAFDVDLVIQRVPIIDFDDQDLSVHLETAINTLHRMIAVGHTMYVHCTAGQERAPSVATAYLIKFQAMAPQQALTHITDLRQCSPKMHVIESMLEISPL